MGLLHTLALIIAAGAFAPLWAASVAPCADCVTLSLTPEQALAAPANLEGAHLLLRVAPGRAASEWSPAFADLGRRGARIGIHLTSMPAPDDPAVTAGGDALLIEVPGSDPDRLAFVLKQVLVRARGANPETRLAIAADGDMLTALMERDLALYVDGYLVRAGAVRSSQASALTQWLGGQAGETIADAAEVISDGAVSGEVRRLWLLPPDPALVNTILRGVARLQSWLPAGLLPAGDRAITCGDRPLPTFLNPRTLDLVALATGCAPSAQVRSDVPGAPAERLDLGRASLIRVRGESGERFADTVRVAAARALTVDEVIARHQAAAARQAALIGTDIATGTLTLTFEAPGFAAPLTVTSRTIMFIGEGRTDVQQQDIRVNGVAFTSNGAVPRLPIIEPERAAAPPLAITLTNVYRYRLAGREAVDGRECYIIAFAPRDRESSLYEGRAWIDVTSFAMLRVTAVQTGLRGPITMSEQTDEFRPDGHGRWLLARSGIRQTYEGAGIRTPIHRLLLVGRHEVNQPDFAARRSAAYASLDLMLRDTPNGYRYLRRPSGAAAARRADVEPIVSGKADRVRTVAVGVIVDPNISRPLPFAGISYVDFDLMGTGAQLNAFFGGSYGQLAFAVPSVGGTRWRLGGRAFAIASSYNDRAFVDGREQYAEDIRQRPAQASVWLLRPLSPRASLRIEYDWDYTRFRAADVTAPDFLVPDNQVVHGARIGLDLQRGGWQGALWWNPARRTGWRRWGPQNGSTYLPGQQDFQRYGASLLRSGSLSPRLALRLEGACLAGRDLDRFSRYSFGTFDNRLHGYPSALIRYDRGAVLRTALAWSAARALRIDGFADTAAVHDPGFGRSLRNYTGLGAALEAPAPFGMLLAAEWGYGLQGVDSSGRRGTHVVRISAYKMF